MLSQVSTVGLAEMRIQTTCNLRNLRKTKHFNLGYYEKKKALGYWEAAKLASNDLNILRSIPLICFLSNKACAL